MSPGGKIISLRESLLIILPSKLAAVYQENYHDLFWMMDYEEHRMSIFSFQFWREGNDIICYFYNFSYLYMPLYQFYTFSTAFVLRTY